MSLNALAVMGLFATFADPACKPQDAPVADATVAPWAKPAYDQLVKQEVIFGEPYSPFRGERNARRLDAALFLGAAMEKRLLPRQEYPGFPDWNKPNTVGMLLRTFQGRYGPLGNEGDEYFNTPRFKQFDDESRVRYELMEYVVLPSGIFIGIPDRKFEYANPLTREELAFVVAACLYGLDTSPELKLERVRFSDLAEDEWSFAPILIAVGTGVMDGYSDHTFRAKRPVTRNELAVTMARLIQVVGHAKQPLNQEKAR